MSKENNLVPFTLKLAQRDHQLVKLLCAQKKELSFQYELLNEALVWACRRNSMLMPVASQRDGVYRSYYVSKGMVGECVEDLCTSWNCNATRAVHTALFHFLREHSSLVASALSE